MSTSTSAQPVTFLAAFGVGSWIERHRMISFVARDIARHSGPAMVNRNNLLFFNNLNVF
jgi:hypothetical protein